jgi:hypothetical protein
MDEMTNLDVGLFIITEIIVFITVEIRRVIREAELRRKFGYYDFY